MCSTLRVLGSRLSFSLRSPYFLNPRVGGIVRSVHTKPCNLPRQLSVEKNGGGSVRYYSEAPSAQSIAEKFHQDMVVPDVISTPPPMAAKVGLVMSFRRWEFLKI